MAWVIADRIAVMYLGRIMEIGPAETVIRSPANPYTRALVSVSPSPAPATEGTRAQRTILVGETPDAAQVPLGCRFHPRCPLAFDRCAREEPPLFDVGGGQSSACWLVEGGGPLPAAPVDPPGRAEGGGRPPERRRRQVRSGRPARRARSPAVPDTMTTSDGRSTRASGGFAS